MPVATFVRGTSLLARGGASGLPGGTTLTVPFPTPATSITPNLPGLLAGPVEAQVWQQTGSAPTFSLIGSAALTVTETGRVHVCTPLTIRSRMPSAALKNKGNRFDNLGFRQP